NVKRVMVFGVQDLRDLFFGCSGAHGRLLQRNAKCYALSVACQVPTSGSTSGPGILCDPCVFVVSPAKQTHHKDTKTTKALTRIQFCTACEPLPGLRLPEALHSSTSAGVNPPQLHVRGRGDLSLRGMIKDPRWG